jgi:hypothetical protein
MASRATESSKMISGVQVDVSINPKTGPSPTSLFTIRVKNQPWNQLTQLTSTCCYTIAEHHVLQDRTGMMDDDEKEQGTWTAPLLLHDRGI